MPSIHTNDDDTKSKYKVVTGNDFTVSPSANSNTSKRPSVVEFIDSNGKKKQRLKRTQSNSIFGQSSEQKVVTLSGVFQRKKMVSLPVINSPKPVKYVAFETYVEHEMCAMASDGGKLITVYNHITAEQFLQVKTKNGIKGLAFSKASEREVYMAFIEQCPSGSNEQPVLSETTVPGEVRDVCGYLNILELHFDTNTGKPTVQKYRQKKLTLNFYPTILRWDDNYLIYVGTMKGRMRIFELDSGGEQIVPVSILETSYKKEEDVILRLKEVGSTAQFKLAIKINGDESHEKEISALEVNSQQMKGHKVKSQYIAVGTQDGHIKVFTISGRQYKTSNDKMVRHWGTRSSDNENIFRRLHCVFQVNFGREVLCCAMHLKLKQISDDLPDGESTIDNETNFNQKLLREIDGIRYVIEDAELAVGVESKLHLYSINDKAQFGKFEHPEWVRDVSFSDGGTLATIDDSQYSYIYDANTGVICNAVLHDYICSFCTFAPDLLKFGIQDSLIIGYGNGTMKIMDQTVGSRVKEFNIPEKIMNCDLSEKYLLVGSTHLRCFNSHDDANFEQMFDFSYDSKQTFIISALLPTNSLRNTNNNSDIKFTSALAMYGVQPFHNKESLLGFIDINTGKEIKEMQIKIKNAVVTCCAVSKKTGTLIAVGSQERKLTILQRVSDHKIIIRNEVTSLKVGIRAVAIDSLERYICAGHEDNGLILYTASTCEKLKEIKTFGGWVRGLSFSVIANPINPSKNITYLAAADWSGSVQVFLLPPQKQEVKEEAWQIVRTFQRKSGIYSLNFYKDRAIITSESDGHVICNDIISGNMLWPTGPCSAVARQVRTVGILGSKILVCGPPQSAHSSKFVAQLIDISTPSTLPDEMPVNFGDWISDQPDLIHRQDPADGSTILHKLAEEGKVPDIESYIHAVKGTGKKIAPITNDEGDTPLDIAINSHDHRKIKLFLVEYVKWKKYQGNDEIGKTLTLLADDYPDLLKLALKYSINIVDTCTIDRMVIDGEKKFKGAKLTRPEKPVWTKDDEDEGYAPEEVVSIVCGFPNFLDENGIIERMAYQENLLTCFETPALFLAIQYKWESYGFDLYFYQHSVYFVTLVIPMT